MKSFFHKFLLLLTLLLAACGSAASLSPEMLVRSKLITAKGVDPFSVRILQSQPFHDHVLILTEYIANGAQGPMQGQKIVCNVLYDTYHDRPNTWAAGSGSRGCSQLGPFGDRSTGTGAGSGAHLMPNGQVEYSYLYGNVVNTDVVSITVTWEDGLVQEARVTQASFMVIREGKHDPIKDEHKDASGRVVYTQTFTSP